MEECSNKIAADLAHLGVMAGQTILVHSSFRSLGVVPGGMETVVGGLLAAIGAQGTLLMPALSWSLRPPEIWNYHSTPTNVGALPEFFRKRQGTMRSVHPTHSVCGIGPRASALLKGHALDCTPCGPHSPFWKLAETDGKIIMLGCGLRPNTSMHALEEFVNPPYLFGPSHLFTITDKENKTYQKEYRTHGFTVHGCTQRYDRILSLDSNSFLRKGKVLDAETFVLNAPQLKDAVLKKLREDPLYFVEAFTG